MKIQNIGLMSPGDMGQAIAQQLKQNGFNLHTALDKRSARTKALAQQAGVADVGSITKLTEQCELIVSVMDPAAASGFADEVARALTVNRRNLVFVECNPLAPESKHAISKKITAAGGRFIDGGIIGTPPRGKGKVCLYFSGPEARELEQFETPAMKVRVLSERIGDASSIKICYGAMTKGVVALMLELLIVARRLGVEEALETQLKETQSAIYDKVVDSLPRTMPKAYRWAPEMLEIARTFESAGLTRRMFEGAYDMYEFIAATKLGKETPEEGRGKPRSGKDVVNMLADERGS